MSQRSFDILFDSTMTKVPRSVLWCWRARRRVLQHRVDDFLRLVFKFVRRDNAIDKADLTRARGADQLAGEKQFANVALAQLPPEKAHDQAGDETASCFRITNLGPLRRDDEVASGQEPGAARDRGAMDLRDRDQAGLADREQSLRYHLGGTMRFFEKGGFL